MTWRGENDCRFRPQVSRKNPVLYGLLTTLCDKIRVGTRSTYPLPGLPMQVRVVTHVSWLLGDRRRPALFPTTVGNDRRLTGGIYDIFQYSTVTYNYECSYLLNCYNKRSDTAPRGSLQRPDKFAGLITAHHVVVSGVRLIPPAPRRI